MGGNALSVPKEKIVASGYAATSYSDCPYVSGQRNKSYWDEGFVAGCADRGSIPEDTDMYLRGRIMYLAGANITEVPKSDLHFRWTTGWLMQQTLSNGEKYSDEASRKRADKTITPFGEAFWRNSAGDLHREDGPASVWGDGSKEWWVNGRRHRKDGPAIERANGDKEWWLNGLHHRNDGPAIERANGDKEWYQKGWRHREDGGPAIELANGYRAWYMNGNLRREDRPVIKHADGTVENLVDGELLEQPQKASVAPKPR